MSKDKQCNDSVNTPIAMAPDGSTPRLHKAAKLNGHRNGNDSKPTSNGSK